MKSLAIKKTSVIFFFIMQDSCILQQTNSKKTIKLRLCLCDQISLILGLIIFIFVLSLSLKVISPLTSQCKVLRFIVQDILIALLYSFFGVIRTKEDKIWGELKFIRSHRSLLFKCYIISYFSFPNVLNLKFFKQTFF